MDERLKLGAMVYDQDEPDPRLSRGMKVKTPMGDEGTIAFVGKKLTEVTFPDGRSSRFPNSALDPVRET